MHGMFDDKTFSDFQIRSEDGNVIYVHKVLMCRWPYFKTLFATGIGKKMKYITVPDIDIARILGLSIYTQHLVVPVFVKVISGDFRKFSMAYDMYKMWTVGKDHKIFSNYAEDHKEKFINDDINNLFTLKKYFKNFRVKDSLIIENKHQITKEHLLKGLFIDYYRFNPDWILPIMVKHKTYDLLLGMMGSLDSSFIFKYFKPSLRQMSFLKRGIISEITPLNLHTPQYRIAISIVSFDPFRIVVYEKIGSVFGKSNKHRSIFVTPTISFSKTDRLAVGNKVYSINSIYHKEKEVNEAYESIEYSIALELDTKETLPIQGSCIYKVIEI